MQGPPPVQWTRDTPWRQGSVLPRAIAERLHLTSQDNPGSTCAVVISHDCDLANSNLESEPAVEVIPARIVHAADGNFLGGKSPRTLHLKMKRGAEEVVVELLINAKRTVPKAELAEQRPDPEFALDQRELRTLQRWLASRYFRAAFANRFVDAMDAAGASDHLARVLRRRGELVSVVYFDVREGAQTEPRNEVLYELTIVLMFPPGSNPEESGQQADALAETIGNALRAKLTPVYGIKLIDCFAVSEDDMRVGHVRRLSEWHLEYMTLRSGEEQPTSPGL